MSETDERTSLLRHGGESIHSLAPKRTFSGHFWPVLIITFIVLILDTSVFISIAPEVEILQNIVCDKYYALIEAGDRDCKIEPIQSEIALLLAWKESFNNLPGISSIIWRDYILIGRARHVSHNTLRYSGRQNWPQEGDAFGYAWVVLERFLDSHDMYV
jgi:hypothetical protein